MKKDIVIAECSSADDARKAVQIWVRQNEEIAAQLGPQDLVVDLVRCGDGKNLFRCRALIDADESKA